MKISALRALTGASPTWRTKLRIASRGVSLSEMDDFLRQHSYPELFNLLPAHFADYQNKVVAAIRRLAGACYKKHHDPNLAKGILRLCKRFMFRDVELRDLLEEDLKTVEGIISRERERDAERKRVQLRAHLRRGCLGRYDFGDFLDRWRNRSLHRKKDNAERRFFCAAACLTSAILQRTRLQPACHA